MKYVECIDFAQILNLFFASNFERVNVKIVRNFCKNLKFKKFANVLFTLAFNKFKGAKLWKEKKT